MDVIVDMVSPMSNQCATHYASKSATLLIHFSKHVMIGYYRVGGRAELNVMSRGINAYSLKTGLVTCLVYCSKSLIGDMDARLRFNSTLSFCTPAVSSSLA